MSVKTSLERQGALAILRSVRLSVPRRSCLGYRHAGCLQLSHRRPPEMCGLRTRPRTDVDPPRFLPPSNCHRRRGISSHRPRGDTLSANQRLIVRRERFSGDCQQRRPVSSGSGSLDAWRLCCSSSFALC